MKILTVALWVVLLLVILFLPEASSEVRNIFLVVLVSLSLIIRVWQKFEFKGNTLLTLRKPRVNWWVFLPIGFFIMMFIAWDIRQNMYLWYVLILLLLDVRIPPVSLTNKGVRIRDNLISRKEFKEYSYFDWNEIEFVYAKPAWYRNKSFRLRPYPHDFVTGEQIRSVVSNYLPYVEPVEIVEEKSFV